MRMSGELPTLDGGDGLAIVLNNVGNNKIDYYLTGEVAYSVNTDPATGTATGELDIALHNGAPSGLTEPGIVFGNSEGAPPGSSVMELSLYSALPVTAMTVDGQSRTADRTAIDHGFNVSTVRVITSASSTTLLKVQLAGPLDLTQGYHLVIRNDASVAPFDTTLVVDHLVAEDLGATAGLRRIDP